MEPYNIKVLTFPDLSRQVRIYSKVVESPEVVPDRKVQDRNPFDGKKVREVLDFDVSFDASARTSLSRTKQKVYQYARSNSWDWFVTFTFSDKKVNRYDYDECTKVLSKWLNNLRRSSPGLAYVVVPEQHKDGAYHFHGLFSGVKESLLEFSGKYVISRFKDSSGRLRFRKTDRKIYRISKYKLGWMTATAVTDRDKVVSYITKYLTKELMVGIYGKKRYWTSRNLFLPVEDVYLVDNWDSVRLSDDLNGLSKFSKKCVVNVGDSEQVLQIFDIE